MAAINYDNSALLCTLCITKMKPNVNVDIQVLFCLPTNPQSFFFSSLS